MEVTFTSVVEFPDETSLPIDFTATFEKGGIGSYECHGFRGYQSQMELEEIQFTKTGLTPEQISFISELIENGKMDELAYNEL